MITVVMEHILTLLASVGSAKTPKQEKRKKTKVIFI